MPQKFKYINRGGKWQVVNINKDNYWQYVDIPDYIIEKWQKGIISYAHFSDILRLELLLKYGGLWMDATVYCTGAEIPPSITNSELFVHQVMEPSKDGHSSLPSNWLIWAKSNNRILAVTRDLLYEYWKRYDTLLDYFIFHHFFTMACERFPNDYKRMPKYDNATPHILQLQLFEPYDADFIEDLKRQTCFHKLTYKLDVNKTALKGTFYESIVKGMI